MGCSCGNPSQLEIDLKNLLANDAEFQQYKDLDVPICVKDCGEQARALYHIQRREIWISPQIKDINSLKEAVLHELIHARDHKNGIPIGTAEGVARSEIHAMKCVECRDFWFKRRCTKENAILAVSLALSDTERARSIVEKVFDEEYDNSRNSSDFHELEFLDVYD